MSAFSSVFAVLALALTKATYPSAPGELSMSRDVSYPSAAEHR